MSKSNSTWMALSDMMTGLMVIFLFIAIAYISQVNKNSNVLADYIETKTKLHDKFVEEFQSDTARWQMQIGKDLSFRFNNPSVLFSQGSWYITPGFKSILKEFLPRYLAILKDDKFRDRISEIRIEGHTDNVPFPALNSDPYIANVILSQRRALSVLTFTRSLPEYQRFTIQEKNMFEYWFTANGLSYGKSLDSEHNYVYKTHKEVDKQASRRVEFRIITNGDDLIKDFIEKNSKFIK